MTWSWGFLAVSLVGAAFTFNAWRPRLRRGRHTVPGFFAGWLTTELAPHHIAWQLLATVVFVWNGALDAWPGWLGLAISGVSWAALLALVPEAMQSRDLVARSLDEARIPAAEDDEHASPTTTGLQRLVVPFHLTDSEVRVDRDIPYGDAGARNLLDVYSPRHGAEGAPVLLQVHGGGWVIGNKREQARPLMLHLARNGWVCVAANYRLSPRATFPDHLIDLKRSIAWIRDNIGRHGGDPDFLAVTGGSAGGHLSALVALTPNDPAYQPGFEDVDTRVDACVPFYGVYDFTNALDQDPDDGMASFLEKMVMKASRDADPEAYRRASPLWCIQPDTPPFFVVHGRNDSLVTVNEAREFVRRLRERSKKPVAYAELPRAQHAFEVFHSPRTRAVVRGVDRFLSHVHARYLEEKGRHG